MQKRRGVTGKAAAPARHVTKSVDVEMRGNTVLPQHVVREQLTENGNFVYGSEYVRFSTSSTTGGPDALLDELTQLLFNSTTLGSIVARKAAMVRGSGLAAMVGGSRGVIADAVDRLPLDKSLARELNDLLLEVNDESQSVLDVIEQGALEFFGFGNAFFIISKMGGRVFLEVSEIHYTRKSVPRTGVDPHIGINPDPFRRTDWSGLEIKKVPLWPKWEEIDGYEKTAIHLYVPTPSFRHYGLPDWITATTAAYNEYGIDVRNAKKIKSNNAPSGVVDVIGSFSDNEATEMAQNIKKSLTNLGQNSGLIVNVTTDPDRKTVFTRMESEAEGDFLATRTAAAQTIVTATKWAPSLSGFAQPGQLGNVQQMQAEYALVQETVIAPVQNLFETRLLSRFMRVLGKANEVFAGVALEILNSTPVAFLNPVVQDSLSTDEKRETAGYGAKKSNDTDN